MEFKYFSKNGEVRPIGEAMIPLSNIEYSYGFGVYESIRAVKGIPFFLKDHILRLEESAHIIGVAHTFSVSFIEKAITKLIEKNEVETCNIKLLLIGGRTENDASLNILCLNPLFPDKKLYRDGASFITQEFERPFPHAKSLNMLQSYLAYKKAVASDCYDALLINKRGNITEGTRTNFFCIQGRTLISPPEQEILLGVTRKAVLNVAKDSGFLLQEKDIPLAEIFHHDGAFVTGTSSKIIPVRSIDSQTLGAPSAPLKELMREFDSFLSECRGVLT